MKRARNSDSKTHLKKQNLTSRKEIRRKSLKYLFLETPCILMSSNINVSWLIEIWRDLASFSGQEMLSLIFVRLFEYLIFVRLFKYHFHIFVRLVSFSARLSVSKYWASTVLLSVQLPLPFQRLEFVQRSGN